MITKRRLRGSVLGHGLKIGAFLALQAALLVGLRVMTASAPEESSNTATYTDAFFQEQIYPYWREDRSFFNSLANPDAEEHPVFEAVAAALSNGSDQYMEAIRDKERLLHEAPGPRMICVGGSGLAFGWDSELLAQRYGYSPINLGLQARLNFQFLLRWAGDNARPGDVVVLCLEPTIMYRKSVAMTDQRQKDILLLAPELSRYFENGGSETGNTWTETWKSAKDYADDQALAKGAAEARRLFAAAQDQLFPTGPSPDTPEGQQFLKEYAEHRHEFLIALNRAGAVGNQVYRRSGFNEFGDLVTHRGHSTVGKRKLANTYPSPANGGITAAITDKLERINAFAKNCAARDVRVFFAYPPLFDTKGVRPFAAHYDSLVEGHLEVPILNEIDPIILERQYFFDSPRHLTWSGTCLRMAELIRGLDEHLDPRTPLSPAAHVAARDRTVRGAIIASTPDSTARR